MEETSKSKECENCEKSKLVELSERVAKLEKVVERQSKQDKQTKLLANIIFYGAVASGFTAIFSFFSMVANWLERFK